MRLLKLCTEFQPEVQPEQTQENPQKRETFHLQQMLQVIHYHHKPETTLADTYP